MGIRSGIGSLALLALWGCSGSSTSISADAAAEDVSAAICQKIDGCSDFFVRLTYGDVATCTARVKIAVANALAAPGTGHLPADLQACAKAIPAASCDDVLDHNLPTACQPVAGQLVAGKACVDSSQCVTAFCNVAGGQTCGACATPPAVGGTCSGDDACPVGAVCKGNPATCVTPAALGAACSTTQPCHSTLVCRAGVCSMPDGPGAACMTAANTCNGLAGLYCGSMTCTQASLSSPGSTCGIVDAGLALCSSSASCTTLLAGTCQTAANDGQNCNTTTGPSCLPPAVCQNGVCTLPDPASCK